MLPAPPTPAPAPRSPIRTIVIAIVAVIAAPFIFVAFLATMNRSR